MGGCLLLKNNCIETKIKESGGSSGSVRKEQEARSAAEQMQASVSTELERVREEKSIAEKKVILCYN